jgi:hypothetical protein
MANQIIKHFFILFDTFVEACYAKGMRRLRDQLPGTDHQGVNGPASLDDFRVWRTLQLLSLLPLSLCVVFIFLSQEPSGFSALLFFMLVAAGIVIPEMKSDMALNRFIVMKEQTGISAELQQLLMGDLQHLLKDPAMRDLLKERHVSPKER